MSKYIDIEILKIAINNYKKEIPSSCAGQDTIKSVVSIIDEQQEIAYVYTNNPFREFRKCIDADRLKIAIKEYKKEMPSSCIRHDVIKAVYSIIDEKPEINLVNVDDVIRFLRNYADTMTYSGQCEKGLGIMKAVNEIKREFM